MVEGYLHMGLPAVQHRPEAESPFLYADNEVMEDLQATLPLIDIAAGCKVVEGCAPF